MLDKISTSFCWLLRHGAVKAGVSIDVDGFVLIQDLVDWYNASQTDRVIDIDDVYSIVNLDEKDRYVCLGLYIRCAQGHSIPNIGLDVPVFHPTQPVYHGTASRFLRSILKHGLKPNRRNYVHMTEDKETAMNVGARYGRPVLLTIDPAAFEYGNCLRRSENGVLLAAKVDPKFITYEYELTEEEKTEVFTICQADAMRLRWLTRPELLHHVNTDPAFRNLPPITEKQLEEIYAEGVSL